MWNAPRWVAVFRCNVELKTLLFCFRWGSFQPVLFGQPSSSKNNSYRSERGTEQRAESVPSVPNTAQVINVLSPAPQSNAESLPCQPSSGAAVIWGVSVWRGVIVDVGAVRLYHALQRVSGSALGDLSHLRLPVVCNQVVPDPLNCHWQIRGGGTQEGGTRGRPNLKKRELRNCFDTEVVLYGLDSAAVLGFHLEVADVFCAMESKVSTGLHKLIIINHKLASRAFALHYRACGTSNPETLMYSNLFSVTINMRWLPGHDPLRMTPM